MKQFSRRPPGATGIMLASVLVVAGCDGLTYVVHLADGQFGVQRNTEPISKVLDDHRLAPEDEDKLRLAVKARDFAAGTIGLTVGNSYRSFYDSGGSPLAFNLSAARRDALVPVTWTFPIVGEVPYLAFFDEAYLHQVQQELLDAGYDTLTYELDAYSTLGMFDDPVRSTMLKRGPISLVETIIHELLHNTVWRNGHTVFNESLATFVGRQGTIDFLTIEYGEETGWPEVARRYYADLDAVDAFLIELYGELDVYFAQPRSAAEKIAGRAAVYQAGRERFVADVQPGLFYPDSFAAYAELPANNAWMLAHYRYHLDLDLLADVYAATGGDWPATVDVFRAAAQAPGDPFATLRTWVAERAAP